MSQSHDPDDFRPDPDHLLQALKSDAQNRVKSTRGKLKIFLGMSAGVGKTYAMLSEAQKLKQLGRDVVIGVIETHGRTDTASLVPGLEQLPMRQMEHRGHVLRELSLDSLLERRPQLALIDELAHTNVPGSRHNKRYQDVEEILSNGIDVFTTVNIQHVESRKSIVEDFSGVRIHETVPDTFFELADEMVLIDIDPEELLNRLGSGQIYHGEKMKTARENFFTPVNLTALRDLALRFTAGRVERDLLGKKELQGTHNTVRSSNKLLVAVFASPFGEALLRWTKQLAESTNGSWIAAYVDTGAVLSQEEKSILNKNFALINALGGQLITASDSDLVKALLRVAHQNNVTQIIVGKSQRSFFAQVKSGGSFVARLLKESNDIDVCVVASAKERELKMPRKARPTERLSAFFPFEEFGWIVALIFTSWFAAGMVEQWVGYQSVGFLFLFAVFAGSLTFSRGNVVAHASISALIWNVFFIPPRYKLSISAPEDVLMLVMFFVVVVVMGIVTHRVRNNEKQLQKSETTAQKLLAVSKELALSENTGDMLNLVPKVFSTALELNATLLIPDEKDLLSLSIKSGNFAISEKEFVVANWVFNNKKPAGRGTETLSHAKGFYFPLMAAGSCLGVIALEIDETRNVPFEILVLTEAISQQAAFVLQKEIFRKRSFDVEVLEQRQHLYTTLFDSVSHELKTPLSGILGASSALLEDSTAADSASLRELANIIFESSQRLCTSVNHLLDMSRIESGFIKAKLNSEDASELIHISLRSLEKELESRKVEVHLPSPIPLIMCDLRLAGNALTNIVRNAANFSPPGSPIHIEVTSNYATVSIRVRDFGPGIPLGQEQHIFEKFFRGNPSRTGGLGLGLSIAKNFVEAQGGNVTGKSLDDTGSAFTLTFPRANS